MAAAAVATDSPSLAPVDRTPSDWHFTGKVIAKGYESVAETFKSNFEEGEEVGAGLCIYVDGKKVIDVEGGYKNTDYKDPYTGSLQLVYSTSKNIEALLIARAVQEGKLHWNDPITKHFPEWSLGANKEKVTIKDLMGHRAGLAWLDADYQIPAEIMTDLDAVAKLLAAQPHNFDGETKQAYHASTRGLVANEIIRRVYGGQTMGQKLQEWFCKPLDVEAYFGLPEELEPRVATFTDYPFADRRRAKRDPEAGKDATAAPGAVPSFPPGMLEKQITLGKTFATFKVAEGVDLFNTRAGRAAEVPSANLVSTARSLAKIGAAIANNGTLDGVEILKKEVLDEASVPQETMDDAALPLPPTPFSTGGWAIFHGMQGPFRLDLPDPEVAWEGWFGYGGSTLIWDRKNNVALSYVMNARQLSATGDRRTSVIIKAFVDAHKAAKTK